MRDTAHAHKGTSLAKGPAWFIGLASLALGILGLIFGSADFGSSPMSGNVDGSTFLGIEGNGWTWALFAAGGLLLLLAAPMHWGAKTMALIVGLAFGAASVISMVDGKDVFGTIATNGLTQLVLGAAAAALLITALLPRVGKKAKHDDHVDHDVVAPAPRQRERVVEQPVEQRVVAREPVGRAHEPSGVVTERHEADGFDRTAADGYDRADRVERTGRFDRTQQPADRESVGVRQGTDGVEHDHHHVEPGQGRVVAPADGDGVEDRGRTRRS